MALAKDELVKRTIQDQVKQVLFVYDTDNQVNSPIGGNYGKHYDVTLSSTFNVISEDFLISCFRLRIVVHCEYEAIWRYALQFSGEN